MKNKIIKISILVLSIFTICININKVRFFYNIYKGNRESNNKNYKIAEEYYRNASKILTSKELKNGILENIIKARYKSEDYEFVVKNGDNEKFLKANSKVKLTEKANSENKNKELEESLDLYKKQLTIKDDLNVKKNYEIVKKMIEDNNNNNNNSSNQNNKNNNQNKDSKGGGAPEKDQGLTDNQKEEISYILKRMEGKEAQTFENNEKTDSNNVKDSSKGW